MTLSATLEAALSGQATKQDVIKAIDEELNTMTTFEDMIKKIAEKNPQPEPAPLYWVEPRPRCNDCRDFEVMNYGDICENCQQEAKQGYKVMYKMGRLANGFALDSGTVYHAVKDMPDYGVGKAICGTQTGRRSAGWHRQLNQLVTCKACLKKLEKYILPGASDPIGEK